MNPKPPAPQRSRSIPKEWRIVSVRECPHPEALMRITSPEHAVAYWKAHVAGSPSFNTDREYVVVLMLNVRLRVRGHHVVSMGGLSEACVQPRECFRIAIMGGAHSILLMHNHPSGDPQPSEADTALTRRLRDAGRLLGIALHDHVVVGHPCYFSFRESGLF